MNGTNEEPTSRGTYSPAITKATKYHRWVFQSLEPAVGKRLVEIGVGSAPFLAWYAGLEKWIPCDIDGSAVGAAELACQKLYSNMDCVGIPGDAGVKEFWSELSKTKPDSVISVNVLEHVADDKAFMRYAFEVLSPSHGTLGVFVPAMKGLYGTLDKAAGHYRRYSLDELESLAKEAGFKVLSVKYFNPIGALTWWIQGRLLKTEKLDDPALNRNIVFFDKYLVPMSKFFNRLSLPFGQSLVLIVRAE